MTRSRAPPASRRTCPLSSDHARALAGQLRTTPDAERAVQRLIPRAWLNTPATCRATAVDGARDRYEPDGQRITVADLDDEGMGTAGHALALHFARHLGDLDAAQRAFWFTRTHTGRPGARRMQLALEIPRPESFVIGKWTEPTLWSSTRFRSRQP
ncbi:hypothetical protein ACWDRX_25150 [Streptomyces nigra]|uniref:hypothetical protein n=1 Tax=Streptomyces nigra TaxID=1827580 RepID=UPI00362D22E0